ncbi:hypothetical protein LTR62_006524 [Meristemomyces frigidus]|uniref:Uncharacterized protein n=1 Tax=Meristemomyces frigidus TaxID=1508187 RepID=A0AAN7TN81_9PEZI|nr:hypothetical protein LTR62_006524 [Meristemomyces frigidus]
MVPLPLVHSTNLTYTSSRPLVAVFIGATSGIGENTLRQLCFSHGKQGAGLRIYLIGRNALAAERIFDDCKRVCSGGRAEVKFVFVQVEDLTLLRGVEGGCREVLALERERAGKEEARIDFLCLTQGFVRFGGAEYTPEGLETSLSLLYYSRIRAIQTLLPLLTTSTANPSTILSVYAAGMEKSGTFYPDDLGLTGSDSKTGKPLYSFANCRTHCVHMTTMAFETLAKQNQGTMALVHVYPGLVIHPKFWHPSFPAWFKIVWFFAYPFANFFLNTKAEENGQRMLFFASAARSRFRARGAGGSKGEKGDEMAIGTDGVPGGGAYSCKYNDEVYDVTKSYVELRKQGFEERVWEHTQEVFRTIDSGEAVAAANIAA